MNRFIRNSILAVTAAASLSFFNGCSSQKKSDTFIIWTDREEFVSYLELFNSLQDKSKAIIVYKPRLANSLPPAKDEEKPDLIVGSWLKNSRTRKNYRSLDHLLGKDSVNTDIIYKPLMEYGNVAGRQYLLPVSFNLPLVIFSTKNENQIPDKSVLSLDQIKETSLKFNRTNKDGTFTKMGFGPSWDEDFLYLVTKQYGQCFKEKGTSFSWNIDRIYKTIEYIKAWTKDNNESTSAEQDFQFKYLYTPKYRQIAAERTLFAYTQSRTLFNISSEQLGDIDYRWISVNDRLPVEDDIVAMTIYSKSKNPQQAEQFIKWFFQEENQKMMLERSTKMQLDTLTFGIASGFSSIKNVNEHLYPTYYRNLLGNLPDGTRLSVPQGFPTRWESLKDRVVYPYLKDAVKTDSDRQGASMESLLTDWSKQFD